MPRVKKSKGHDNWLDEHGLAYFYHAESDSCITLSSNEQVKEFLNDPDGALCCPCTRQDVFDKEGEIVYYKQSVRGSFTHTIKVTIRRKNHEP